MTPPAPPRASFRAVLAVREFPALWRAGLGACRLAHTRHTARPADIALYEGKAAGRDRVRALALT
jgi:hypothetical protein